MATNSVDYILSLHSEIDDLSVELAKAIALTELLLGADLQEYSALDLHLNLSLLIDLLLSIEKEFNYLLSRSHPNLWDH